MRRQRRREAAQQRPAGAATRAGAGRSRWQGRCRGAAARTAAPGGERPDRAARGDPPGGGPDRQRVAGTIPAGATRRVSLHDADARPIAKGQLGKPVQFGYKAQVVDSEEGIVLDHNLEQGNPPDAPRLAPAVERIITRTGRTPRTATADRGYGQKSVDDALHDLGVQHVVIPRKGKPGQARQAEEHRPAFRRTVKWRTGSEGLISSLTRGYGCDRTRLDGTEGAGSGPDRGSSPTTWSRSEPWPANRAREGVRSALDRSPPPPLTSAQRVLQVEVASISAVIGTRWGVTEDEVTRWYPCDDVVPDAPIQLWRGVTIEVPRAQVWPWVRQLRLAPYSYDWIDNLGRRSPRQLAPLPDPVPGEAFTKVAGRFAVGRVISTEPEDHLTAVIMGAVMSYVVHEQAGFTRLLLKIVMDRRHWYSMAVAAGDWSMARRQLLNLKKQAEAV